MTFDDDILERLAEKAELVQRTRKLWKEQMMEAPIERPSLMDLPPAEHGVEVSHDGQMLRVNVDGICRLRVRVTPDKLALEVTEETAKANRDAVIDLLREELALANSEIAALSSKDGLANVVSQLKAQLDVERKLNEELQEREMNRVERLS